MIYKEEQTLPLIAELLSKYLKLHIFLTLPLPEYKLDYRKEELYQLTEIELQLH